MSPQGHTAWKVAEAEARLTPGLLDSSADALLTTLFHLRSGGQDKDTKCPSPSGGQEVTGTSFRKRMCVRRGGLEVEGARTWVDSPRLESSISPGCLTLGKSLIYSEPQFLESRNPH